MNSIPNNETDQTATPARRLVGRRALVTGAASGIGLATAHRLAEDGATVVLSDARVGAVAEAAAAVGAGSTGVVIDVGDERSVAGGIAAAVDHLGGLDVLVCCAGIVRATPTHETSLTEWETMLRVNLTGTFLPVKYAIPHLLAAGGGSIVTVGSVASVVAAGRCSGYDASKGGVLQFTRAIAVEYVEAGIRANCVLPGVVETGLAANSTTLHGPLGEQPASTGASRLRIPMERRAHPSELAAAIAFLAPDDASFITGAAIPVDGGYTAI